MVNSRSPCLTVCPSLKLTASRYPETWARTSTEFTAAKRPTYSSKSKTVRLVGVATVTEGGGGAAACWFWPQLATKVANSSKALTRINEIDGIDRAAFMKTW